MWKIFVYCYVIYKFIVYSYLFVTNIADAFCYIYKYKPWHYYMKKRLGGINVIAILWKRVVYLHEMFQCSLLKRFIDIPFMGSKILVY